MYTASQHGLEPVKGAFIIKGGPALVSQEEGHLIFIFTYTSKWFQIIFYLFIFSFLRGCIRGTWKFPGQGLN